MKLFKRYLKPPSDSFFLFGPRGTGKSTWLQSEINAALYIDLLESDRFLELSAHPSRLRELCSHLEPNDYGRTSFGRELLNGEYPKIRKLLCHMDFNS